MPTRTRSQTPEYIVQFVTEVDHPEHRDPSFIVQVQPGTRHTTKIPFESRGNALRFAQGLMDGESDFASEYTVAVEVYQPLDRHPWLRRALKRLRRDGRHAPWHPDTTR